MPNEIKILRENLKLTQEQVSELTGVPVKTLRNWEQGSRTPSEWTLDLVMDRLLRIKLEECAEITDSQGIPSFLSIKENVNEIAKHFDVERIYLFGSYIKGHPTEDSDIDLFMESDLFGMEYFAFAEALREKLHKRIGLLSDKTVEPVSKIREEIKSTGVLIYER